MHSINCQLFCFFLIIAVVKMVFYFCVGMLLKIFLMFILLAFLAFIVSCINSLGWHARVELNEGLQQACQDFVNNHA